MTHLAGRAGGEYVGKEFSFPLILYGRKKGCEKKEKRTSAGQSNTESLLGTSPRASVSDLVSLGQAEVGQRGSNSETSTMAHVLFSQVSHPHCHSRDDRLAGRIRLSVFLIAGECVGAPVLAWALRVLYGHYKSGGRISALVIILLLSDLLVLLLSPYVVTVLSQDDECWGTSRICWIASSLWSASMIYGFLLQQAVALEGALSFRHPPCSAHAFFPSCTIITSIIGFTCFFLCELFSAVAAIVYSLPLFLVIPLTTCIVTCRAPPQTNDFSHRTRKPSLAALAFVTLPAILFVFLAVCAFYVRYWDLWVMNFSLMSLRVIIDLLLCVLVYRKDLKLQTPQASAEHSTDIGLTQIQSSSPQDTDTAQEV
ncbi:hypothetical protein NFI96_004538 [Prochilodus magdalenae]|nr:hypothetical protein NFI96_004538 [Prochilodus magdalenae]